jgi:hypothetical protein
MELTRGFVQSIDARPVTLALISHEFPLTRFETAGGVYLFQATLSAIGASKSGILTN